VVPNNSHFVAPTFLASLLVGWTVHAGTVPEKQGAQLLKTDIMGVFAHPDDETGMAAILAYYALGRTSVVAHVYCTRGEGGGNMVGTQWGPALGHLREAELRDCLNTLGVRYCYFLDRLDWAYTESVSATLRKWDKEQTLEKLVRLVRELRPEVIVTMNPAPSPGQHGHHQAAGVLATEAFAAAADPSRFPHQLTREGLTVWQPRKLYYGGGSTGALATIDIARPLPNGQTPGQVAALALAHHRSQAFGNFGNSPWMQRPQRFTLVKSYVPGPDSETDLLQGLPVVELQPRQFPKPERPALTLEFVARPAVANYERWAAEQGIEHVAAQFTADLPVICGEANEVILHVVNHSPSSVEGELRLSGPEGWSIAPEVTQVQAAAGTTQVVKLSVRPPSMPGGDVQLMAALSSRESGSPRATAKLHPVPRAQVARVALAPALDGSDRGWENIQRLNISSTNVWQGKAANDADCSAVFGLAHDGQTLFLDVVVKDDVVVSNIAPNDIKGHWRSDSIEICLDPMGGAEHTMRCYKLGVFPFDSTGMVRGARDADANQGPVEETAPKTRLFSSRTADGYRIQAAIPFEEIGLKAIDGKRLGFNLLIYDGDKKDAALGENINKCRLAWSPRPGVMGRPEDWGRIDLE
jgi:LmbE family N-acetylglucosaminyl deacetylase